MVSVCSAFALSARCLNVVEIDGADDNQSFFAEERGRTRAAIFDLAGCCARVHGEHGRLRGWISGAQSGGVVNTVTKSGGPMRLHGEAYCLRTRNSSRSAAYHAWLRNEYDVHTERCRRTTVCQHVSVSKPKDNFARSSLASAAGGALIKDKLFWFYAFDQNSARNFPGFGKAARPRQLFFVRFLIPL